MFRFFCSKTCNFSVLLLLSSTACICNCSLFLTENQLCNISPEGGNLIWLVFGQAWGPGSSVVLSSRETADGKWPHASFFDEAFSFVNMLPSYVVPCQKHWQLAKTANSANYTVYDPLYRTVLDSWLSFLTLTNLTICWSPPYVKPPLLEVKRFPNGGN